MPPEIPTPPASSSSPLIALFGRGDLPPPRFTLSVRARGAAASDVELRVRSFTLEEALHAPYALRVQAVADTPDFDPDPLLATRVVLEITRGEQTRVVHGVVLESELLGDGHDEPSIRLEVVPALALLGLQRRSRVFQGVSVPEIVETLVGPMLARHGSGLCRERLVASYEPRDTCVQYRETDLAFVLRILAEEGITLLFDHGGEAETVVLIDDAQGLPPMGREPLEDREGDSAPPLPFAQERADELPVESIRALGQHSRLHRGRWSATAWDWKSRPTAVLRSERGPDFVGSLGGWCEADEGRAGEGEHSEGPVADPTRRRAELQQRRDHAVIMGLRATSNATALRLGSVFELMGAPHDGYGETWAVGRIRHSGDAPHAAVGGSGGEAKAEYSNELECQPHRARLMPPRPARPHAAGVHSAVVTGPPGEVIHTDRFGRIRVRMLWDEDPHEDEHTSCWLRVALPWAGDDLGTVFIPRVGTEVVVSFIDGDPDRPLCSGCMFNGAAMPPYPLPDHKTRTVLRTKSTDGHGYNELSFEDAAGAEQVFLHAQRDLREHVRAGHRAYVGGQQHLVVGASRSTGIYKDDTLTVSGDQQHTVAGSVSQHFRSGYRLRVSDAPKGPAGDQGMTTTVERGTYEVDAADAIVLRCGESRIEILRDQILLTSPQILARCSREADPHPTAVSLTVGAIEITANELRHRAVDARIEADERINLGVGPQGASSSLCLAHEAATLRAKARMDLEAVTIAAVGSESLTLDGELAGLHGKQVNVDAESSVEISTTGRVVIRGEQKISLN